VESALWEVSETAAERFVKNSQRSEDSWVGPEGSEVRRVGIESRVMKKDERSGSLEVLLDERPDHCRSSSKKRSVGPEEVEESGVSVADGVQ
jgi:hypothetical protein